MPRHLRRFSPGWKLSVFTLLLLPVLISLGFWQLAREQEKQGLQALYELRSEAAPVALEALPVDPAQLAYRAVQLRGEYDNERLFLLDNRVRDGRPGVEVIAPFLTESGRLVLVNRGWLVWGPYRDQLPEIPPARGTVTIVGRVHLPAGEALTLADEGAFESWPRLLQSIDNTRMASELAGPGEQVFPYTVRLAAGEAGALATGWPVITTRPEKHRAYAVQWFAMALALLALFVYAGFRADDRDEDNGSDIGSGSDSGAGSGSTDARPANQPGGIER